MNARLAGLLATLRTYAEPRQRTMLLLGFASGLPFPLVLMTLAARLKQSGIDRSTIGYFAWVGLAYSLKFFWSPMVDRLRLPGFGALGRRRSWMVLAQLGTIGGLATLAFIDPAIDPSLVALVAVATAFCAATQDIAVDAYRIESAGADLQAALVATYQVGYQVALIAAQAGALLLAAEQGWTTAYLVMAALLGIGVLTALTSPEPPPQLDRATIAHEQRVIDFLERNAHWPAAVRDPVAWLIGAVVCPLTEFFARLGWKPAFMIVALIVTYRLNYMTMGVMANPFYLDLGFTLKEIAAVSKTYGVIMTLTGSLVAGALVVRLGIPRVMLIGLLLLTAGNLAYAYVADIHPGLGWFAAVVSVDNLGNGIAGTAFIAYMSSLINRSYTATQYALFGTLWSLPAKSLAGFSGRIVDAIGYREFFVYTALLGIPALLLVLRLLRQDAARARGAQPA